jgi:hypothetical protein
MRSIHLRGAWRFEIRKREDDVDFVEEGEVG